MPAGCVAVVDTNSVRDGVVRDLAGVLSTGLPVWASGTAAPPSVAGFVPAILAPINDFGLIRSPQITKSTQD